MVTIQDRGGRILSAGANERGWHLLYDDPSPPGAKNVFLTFNTLHEIEDFLDREFPRPQKNYTIVYTGDRICAD